MIVKAIGILLLEDLLLGQRTYRSKGSAVKKRTYPAKTKARKRSPEENDSFSAWKDPLHSLSLLPPPGSEFEEPSASARSF